ncbi:hypothetical protein ANO11243_076190 [Dothideomycetidae sp. 11243]|nr:hypothetical protein ANO11243_076190 [fungal sp. No.11243]
MRLVTHAFLTLDDAAVASLINAPDPTQDTLRDVMDQAYARVVDVEYDEETTERGPEYRGWMRVRACALYDLYSLLLGGWDQMEQFTPEMEYHGQIPVYDMSPGGRILDPPGGTKGRLPLLSARFWRSATDRERLNTVLAFEKGEREA